MKPASLLYWTRIGTAILAALLCQFLNLTESTGLILCMMVYVGTSMFFEYGLKPKTNGSKGRKVWTTGIGTYYILWIMVWTLLNTVLRGE